MFEITRAVLQTFGINSTISANDLRSGWRKFCNYNPDLVIIDWLENDSLEDQGAITDGLKLMHAIRHDDKSPNKFVPAIMMTGYSIKRNINLARDYGATEFIAKPFTAETLYRKMEHIIEHPRRFVRAPGFSALTAGGRRKIRRNMIAVLLKLPLNRLKKTSKLLPDDWTEH